jgi:hypothetical protein
MLGEALAWEYIRNVGIDGCKPDTHLRRFLGSERMGNASGAIATVDETIRQIEVLSAEVNLPLSSIDNIIWSYCADGYGEVCTATPHCEKCVIHGSCARNSSKDIVPNCANIALTYEKLVAICRHFDYDSEEIGKFIISLVTDKENENE